MASRMTIGIPKDLKSYAIDKNSDYLKLIVASYYRFIRGFKIICTEFESGFTKPYTRMDVIAVNEKGMSTEIECKIDKHDLKNEFKSNSKTIKHFKFYNFQNRSKYHYVPNYFYFMITKDMAKDKEVFELIEKLNSNYGIMVEDGITNQPIIKKSAKRLHDKTIPNNVLLKIYQRICNDNIILRKEKYFNGLYKTSNYEKNEAEKSVMTRVDFDEVFSDVID